MTHPQPLQGWEQDRARRVRRWVPGCEADIRLDRHARHLITLRGFFEPYPTAAVFPPSLVGSVAASERGFEELEL